MLKQLYFRNSLGRLRNILVANLFSATKSHRDFMAVGDRRSVGKKFKARITVY